MGVFTAPLQYADHAILLIVRHPTRNEMNVPRSTEGAGGELAGTGLRIIARELNAEGVGALTGLGEGLRNNLGDLVSRERGQNGHGRGGLCESLGDRATS